MVLDGSHAIAEMFFMIQIIYVLGKFLSQTLIKMQTDILVPDWEILSIFPKLWIEFVDVKSITTKHR